MMAKFSILILFIITLLIMSLLTSLASAGEDPGGSFARPLDPKAIGLKKEKFSHIRFYWHNIFSGKNPSAVTVVQPMNTSTTNFGRITVINDTLTVGPKLSSKLVARAQGFYASTSQEEMSLSMAMNCAFKEGKYNGSSITLLGRNPVFNKMREMPLIGGSGLFRFATGYAKLTTYWADPATDDATVRYNISMKHYEVR